MHNRAVVNTIFINIYIDIKHILSGQYNIQYIYRQKNNGKIEISMIMCNATIGCDCYFKGPYADHILIPRAQPEVGFFYIK